MILIFQHDKIAIPIHLLLASPVNILVNPLDLPLFSRMIKERVFKQPLTVGCDLIWIQCDIFSFNNHPFLNI